MLGGGAAAAATGAGVTGVAVRKAKKPDPLVDYTQTCDELCFAKQQEAQAESDVATAQAQLTQIDQAYFKALDYLDNQLRQDYLNQRKIHFLAAGTLIFLPGIASLPLSAGAYLLGLAGSAGMATGIGLTQDVDPGAWNAQVDAAMKSAHGEIDGIHDQNRAPWQAKLDDAQQRQTDTFNGRHAAEYKLVELRASNPGVDFPACGCEG